MVKSENFAVSEIDLDSPDLSIFIKAQKDLFKSHSRKLGTISPKETRLGRKFRKGKEKKSIVFIEKKIYYLRK